MKRLSTFTLCAATLVGTFALAGCKSEPADDAAPAAGDAASTTDPNAPDDPFAALPEADRIAALAQKICPVGDAPLGSMGTPIKVTIEGRDVYLCCDHCREDLEADPQKYFAKLDGASADADEPAASADETAPADDASAGAEG